MCLGRHHGGLGDGIDAMIARAFKAREAGHSPTALGVPAAEIKPEFQGRRLADRVLDGWRMSPAMPGSPT